MLIPVQRHILAVKLILSKLVFDKDDAVRTLVRDPYNLMRPYISTCIVVDVKFLPVISSFLTNDNIGLSVFCAYVENNKYKENEVREICKLLH